MNIKPLLTTLLLTPLSVLGSNGVCNHCTPFVHKIAQVEETPLPSSRQIGDIYDISVVDGDTLKARWNIPYPPLETIYLRVHGMDAPELFHPKCKQEKELALKAKEELEELVKQGIHYEILSWDKYGGRILINLTVGGKSVIDIMLEKGLVIRYFGEQKTHDWCTPVTSE